MRCARDFLESCRSGLKVTDDIKIKGLYTYLKAAKIEQLWKNLVKRKKPQSGFLKISIFDHIFNFNFFDYLKCYYDQWKTESNFQFPDSMMPYREEISAVCYPQTS